MKLLTIVRPISLIFISLTVLAQDPRQQLNDQLWEATRKGDPAAVAALLDKGADVNAKFRYGTTALFKAAERGNVEIVKILLERGADLNVKDTFYGATAMTWALSNKHVDVVRMLLEKDGSAAGDVLMTGAREGDADLLRVALDKGGLKPETLTAALAVVSGDKDKGEIIELLKKAGATPPMEVDATTLQTYVGRYKADQGPDIVIALQEGKLVATPASQRGFAMMASDKTTFRPIAFEGLSIAFTVDSDKVTGFTLKQGQTATAYKKVSESTQP